MAILKDSTVTGNLRVTGTIYGDVPLDDLTGADDLKAIEDISAVNGILRKTAANTWELVNTVTPSSHAHGNITNDGKIGTEANKAVYTGTGGVVTAGVLPVSAGGTGTTEGVLWNNIGGKPSSYTPSSHAHGNISNNGELATADMAVVTGANKQITTVNLASEDPDAESTTSTTFIDTISQDSLGKITATKKTLPALPVASTSVAGIVKLGTGDNDAATGTHVHSYAASNSPGGSATSAIGFATAKTIALTGNVTGSATGGNGNNGWSIATTIGNGVVTNAMLANSKMTIAGNEISLGGSLTTAALKSDLGLKALAYKDSLTASDVGALPLTGGTLTDALTLSGPPTENLHAATKQYVDGIVAANDAMVFKGTLNGGTTTTYTPAANCGDTYKVATAGLINGERVEVGDILICMADGVVQATSSNVNTVKTSWAIVQNNVDGAVFKSTNTFTDGQILVADGTNGKIKTSGYTVTNVLKWHSTTSKSTELYDFGFYVNANAAAGTGPTGGNYFAVLNFPYRKAAGNTKADWGWQIGGSTGNDGRLLYRTTGDNVFGSWQEIAHAPQGSSNIGSATQPVYMTSTGVITAGTALKALAYKDSLTAADVGAATSGHTHTTSLASGGTSTVNLSANTVYTLTAGGTSVVFKTPADSDTKNTAGSTNSNDKLYLIGATSQAANPQTYSDEQVYTKDGQLDANKIRVAENVTLTYNSTEKTLDFVFA